MGEPLNDAALDTIFRTARTYNRYHDRPVAEDQVRAIWELMKWGPTSANQLPARFVWCLTDDAKARLADCASAQNAPKILAAPASVIVAMDEEFPDHLPMLFPHEDARPWFADPDARRTSAMRNSTLQGAYLLIAARALGLDTGPMSGFDNARVDAEFFAATPAVKSNFIATLGYGDPASIFGRLPRPAFELFNRIA